MSHENSRLVAFPAMGGSSAQNSSQVSNVQLNIGVANQPVMAGNQINISAEGCSDAKMAAVVFEQHQHEHHHYGTESPPPSAEPGSNFERQRVDEIIDFEDLKGKLRDTYSRMWLKPLPFLKLKPLKTFYIELNYEFWDLTGRRREKSFQNLNHVFRGISSKRFSLVMGGSGCGKTILLTKMAYDWATGEQPFLADYDLVLLYNLRNLPKGANLEDELKAEFLNLFGKQMNSQQEIQVLETFRMKKTLLLLDGYDELDDDGQASLRYLLHNSFMFSRSTYIVTSRHVENEEFLRNFQMRIKISSLNQQSRNQVIENYFLTWGDSSRGELLKRFISQNSLYTLLNQSPLLLFICCFVFEESATRIIHKVSNLIPEMVRKLIICQIERHGKKVSDIEIEAIVISLGKLFWKKLQEKSCIFSGEELEAWFEGNFEIVMSVLLFQPTCGENNYEPLHKSFLETLSCNYLNSITDTGERMKEIQRVLGNVDEFTLDLYHGEESVAVFGRENSELKYEIQSGSLITEGSFETSDYCKTQYENYKYIYWYYRHADQKFVRWGLLDGLIQRNVDSTNFPMPTLLWLSYEFAKKLFSRGTKTDELSFCFNEDSDRIDLQYLSTSEGNEATTSDSGNNLSIKDLVNAMFFRTSKKDDPSSTSQQFWSMFFSTWKNTHRSKWKLRLNFLANCFYYDTYRYNISRK